MFGIKGYASREERLLWEAYGLKQWGYDEDAWHIMCELARNLDRPRIKESRYAQHGQERKSIEAAASSEAAAETVSEDQEYADIWQRRRDRENGS